MENDDEENDEEVKNEVDMDNDLFDLFYKFKDFNEDQD